MAFATLGVRLGHLRHPSGLEGSEKSQCSKYLHRIAASTEKLLRVIQASLQKGLGGTLVVFLS